MLTSLFLSCGPIFEPIMGVICATIASIGLILYFGIKFFKSERYNRIKPLNSWDKILETIILVAATVIFIIFLWWILMFLFTGAVFAIEKWI